MTLLLMHTTDEGRDDPTRRRGLHSRTSRMPMGRGARTCRLSPPGDGSRGIERRARFETNVLLEN